MKIRIKRRRGRKKRKMRQQIRPINDGKKGILF